MVSTESSIRIATADRDPRLRTARKWRTLASGPVFRRTYRFPRAGGEALVVGQLHLGCARYSRDAAQRWSNRCFLRMLQLSNGSERDKKQAGWAKGNHSYRRSCAALVRRHRVYLKNHAPVPVGTTRRPLVHSVESNARGNLESASRVASRSGMVWRSSKPQLASENGPGSRGRFC